MDTITVPITTDKSFELYGTPQECPRCLFTSDIASIGSAQCEYCDIHDDLEKQSRYFDLELDEIEKSGRKYNCLIGISGGADSSTLLYAAVREWGLRPLVVHFNNWWNKPEAKRNMEHLITTLEVDAQVHYVNKYEYTVACRAFLVAGLPDADIVNDMVMTKIMYDVAERYGIKYILNGHNFRTEGSTPRAWTYMDARYIKDVVRKNMGRDVSIPLPSMWDQVRWAMRGIKQVRPFHFTDVDYDALFRSMCKEIKWEEYGGKHGENIYTQYVGGYLLPVKFGIDKRRVYLSAQVRSGTMSREDALTVLSTLPTFDLPPVEIEHSFVGPNHGDRNDYRKYNWKRMRFMVWLMWILGAVPRTFYVKYCK